jgi:hypothetical protein
MIKIVALVAALVMTGCAVGDKSGEGSPDRPRGLAVPPTSLPPVATEPTHDGGASPSAGGTASRTSTSTHSGGPRASTSASVAATTSAPAAPSTSSGAGAPAPPFHSVGHVTDRGNDAQGNGPSYADIVSVDVADNGPSARVTITFAGTLPGRIPDGQQLGAGVDFFRRVTDTEGDYQLFVDGSPDGYFAYLHDRDSYEKYPGDFGLGGSRVVFTVPWSALGNRKTGRFSAFADWASNAGSAGNHPFSEDHVPNLANSAYG